MLPLVHLVTLLHTQGREIAPLISSYVKARLQEQRKEDDIKGVVRGSSMYLA